MDRFREILQLVRKTRSRAWKLPDVNESQGGTLGASPGGDIVVNSVAIK